MKGSHELAVCEKGSIYLFIISLKTYLLQGVEYKLGAILEFQISNDKLVNFDLNAPKEKYLQEYTC